jgi:hypothetical protein
MAKQEVPLTTLADYLPDRSAEKVMKMLNDYAVHLTITKQRQSILGDYRPAHDGKPHRISVNGNLNPYGFLITLLHELAHLLTFEQYRNRVQPHGKEWKHLFGLLLQNFTLDKVFPEDVEAALKKSMHNPGASSCSDLHLMRTLRKYDAAKEGHYTVEQLETGTHFEIKDGRKFVKGEKNRTRYKCQLLGTKQFYLFHGLYEVMVKTNSN